MHLGDALVKSIVYKPLIELESRGNHMTWAIIVLLKKYIETLHGLLSSKLLIQEYI